jgi:alanine dehydrogenase
MDDTGYQDVSLPQIPSMSVAGPARLFIGTDRHVGEEKGEPETRVAVTPAQVRLLLGYLKSQGIDAQVSLVAGAGQEAGFSDEQYRAAGCRIVEESSIGTIDPPHVVVALKEPTPYETSIPGHPLRVGALHTGDFHENSGLAAVLKMRKYSAVFDGSEVGHFAYQFRGGPSVPLRGSQSVFAGRFAGERTLERHPSAAHAKAVICGLGIAGNEAAEHVLSNGDGVYCTNNCVLLIEQDSVRCERLREVHSNDPRVAVINSSRIGPRLLQDATAVILAGSLPGKKAPIVVPTVTELLVVCEGASVIDLSIDEGGSIGPGGHVGEQVEKLGRSIRYLADSHVPRNYPRDASEAHGRAVLPYLIVLLCLAARYGDPRGVVEFVAGGSCDVEPHDEFEALICDLRAGMMFTGPFPQIVGDVKDRAEITRFLRDGEYRGATWST